MKGNSKMVKNQALELKEVKIASIVVSFSRAAELEKGDWNSIAAIFLMDSLKRDF